MSSLPAKRLGPSKHRPASPATDVLCNTRTQVCWALAGGLGQAHREKGNAPRSRSPPTPKKEGGDAVLQGSSNMVWQMEGLYCKKGTGQKLEKEFSGFLVFFSACLGLGDKSGEAGVRWVLKMDSRRQAGRKGGAGRKRWEALPRKSREAGIRRAESRCVRSSWAW